MAMIDQYLDFNLRLTSCVHKTGNMLNSTEMISGQLVKERVRALSVKQVNQIRDRFIRSISSTTYLPNEGFWRAF